MLLKYDKIIFYILTKHREIKGLINSMKKYDLNKGIIITKNHEEKIKIDNKTILIKPLWKFLLE